VRDEQDKVIAWLDKRSEFHFRGEGTDVKFNTKGRTWVNCCGTRNMPDGEIFTCPVDSSADGVMTFRYPAINNGREVEGIRLVFKQGEVVEASAEQGEDLLQSLLHIDEGAKRCGEIAIGTNYDISRFSKIILFDEKIGGTIHMALGNAMPYAGGVNQSAIHWDMIADMTSGEISADGEVFYRNGKLLI
jgi:aminopeptidase